ncbi:Ribosomal L1 domain-containing protein 1 [Orchesella cincta]|uniref:Ribosomal L1 domain-containing protein 1 n=1 Tax=Orchesella cincta TaxID=48709 RepID=A0A1D2MNI4_ORCCI|nr:Ribosomal L1 domain-containing protein 1 [Orchesella cincta]
MHKSEPNTVPADFDVNQVKAAAKALIKYASKSKSDSLFMDAPSRIMMDIRAFKIPEGKDHFYNIRLAHPPNPELTELDVLLVVPDLNERDPDHVVGEVKDEIVNSTHADKIKIREVMTLKQFRDDYSTFEAKRALAKSLDALIVDNKIWKMIPGILGREFFKKKKFPISIPGRKFKKADIGEQIWLALHKTTLNLSLNGLCSTVVVGHDTLSENELADNATSIVSWLSSSFPGGWTNVQKLSLNIGQKDMPPLSIYMSTGSTNDVKKRPRTKGDILEEPIEDEISTQLGKRMKIFPSGDIRVLRSDVRDELDDILCRRRPISKLIPRISDIRTQTQRKVVLFTSEMGSSTTAMNQPTTATCNVDAEDDFECYLKWMREYLPKVPEHLVGVAGGSEEKFIKSLLEMKPLSQEEENLFRRVTDLCWKLNMAVQFTWIKDYESAFKCIKMSKDELDFHVQSSDIEPSASHILAYEYAIDSSIVFLLREILNKHGLPGTGLLNTDVFKQRWNDLNSNNKSKAVIVFFKACLMGSLKIDDNIVLDKFKEAAALEPGFHGWHRYIYRKIRNMRRSDMRRNLPPGDDEKDACTKAFCLRSDLGDNISNMAGLKEEELRALRKTLSKEEVNRRLTLLTDLLKYSPSLETDPWVKIRLAEIYGLRDYDLDPTHAAKLFLECTNQWPLNTMVWHKAAKFYHLGGTSRGGGPFVNYEKAKQFYKRSLELRGSNFPCLMDYLKLLLRPYEAIDDMVHEIDHYLPMMKNESEFRRLLILKGILLWIHIMDAKHRTLACNAWLTVLQKFPSAGPEIARSIKARHNEIVGVQDINTLEIVELLTKMRDDIEVNEGFIEPIKKLIRELNYVPRAKDSSDRPRTTHQNDGPRTKYPNKGHQTKNSNNTGPRTKQLTGGPNLEDVDKTGDGNSRTPEMKTFADPIPAGDSASPDHVDGSKNIVVAVAELSITAESSSPAPINVKDADPASAKVSSLPLSEMSTSDDNYSPLAPIKEENEESSPPPPTPNKYMSRGRGRRVFVNAQHVTPCAKMPIRYFGRTNQNFGRPLWEIVMNLKNFGKGRLITRSKYLEDCPDVPSYYRIVGVQPHILEYPETFKGNIYVEEVFRGRNRSEVIDIGKEAELADFQLVHKDQEPTILKKVEEFLANPDNHTPIVRPKTAPLPPVWKLIIARERNISPSEVPEIPIIYEDIEPEIHRPTRIAKDGEEPDFRIGPGHFRSTHKEFYEHVIWNREAAREKYCKGPMPDPDYLYLKAELPPLELEKKTKQSSKLLN